MPKIVFESINYHGGFDAEFGNMGRIIAPPGYFYRTTNGQGGFFSAISHVRPRRLSSGLGAEPLGFEESFTQWLLTN